jgi:hypothetical protein
VVIAMTKPQPPKIWDRRPWPTIGDAAKEKTFEAVGRALTAWEMHEGILSVLFASFVSPQFVTKAGMRAYSAVRTFEGRAEMLRAASSAYFDQEPDDAMLKQFKGILTNASCFSPRRNEITHASVYPFSDPEGKETDTYALYPAYASFKERDLKNKPSYCMTSAEIDYFTTQFESLRAPISDLTSQIATREIYKKSWQNKSI